MQELPLQANPIARGNAALRAGQYELAIQSYVDALISMPQLGPHIQMNIAQARTAYRAQREISGQQTIAVCGWELGHNAAGRVYTLALLYQKMFGAVDVVGCIYSKTGQGIWPPVKDIKIPKRTFLINNWSNFINQAIQLVAQKPYDFVHLSKPRAPNIIFGILYKLIWGAKVIVDIDDEELAFVGAKQPIAIDDYANGKKKLPSLDDLSGREWTQIAVGLAGKFDGITVSNPHLQSRYGGSILRHVRDEDVFKPSAEFTRANRLKFGIPQGSFVVLFFGTPRAHKGLLDTARAISELQRPDIVFAIVGDFPDQVLKHQLMDIPHVNYKFIENQPFEAAPSVVSIADVVVAMQDISTEAGQFQSPAKISDALAMRVPVIASKSPSLKDEFSKNVLIYGEATNLPTQLNNLIKENLVGRSLNDENYTFYQKNLSFESVRKLIHTIVLEDKSIDRACCFSGFVREVFGKFFYIEV